jgi:multiple sugar transport system substrate-binding protein
VSGAVAALAGCQGLNNTSTTSTNGPQDSPTDSPEATIDLYTAYQTEDWFDRWDELIADWNARSESHVNLELPRGQAWPERLRTLVEQGRPPELYNCRLPEIPDLVARGATRPVDDLVADLEASNGDLITEGDIRVGGTTYLVPHGLELGSVFCYRTDVYEDLGLSVPDTWDDLVENARAIDEAESFDGRGFAVAAPQGGGKGGADLRTLVANAGGGVWEWADQERERAALAFRPDSVQPALQLLQTLAQYSPSPTELNYQSTITNWVRGDVGQCLYSNAMLAGAAYETGQDDLAANTGVALPPVRDRSIDPVDRGWAEISGTPVFDGADAPNAAERFLRFCYEGPDRQAAMNTVRPSQFLPPYEDVLPTDTYRETPAFDGLDGHLYDLHRKLVEDMAPHLDGDRPQTVATWHAERAPVLSRLVRNVVVDGQPVEPALADARERLQSRLETGRELGTG